MKLTVLLGRSRQSFSKFWEMRDARERTILSATSAAIVLGLIHMLLIDSALTGRDQLNNDLPKLRRQVAELQALSKEAATLSGKHAPVMASITSKNIEAALARSGLKPQSLSLTDDSARVQLKSVSFSGTLAWLNEMQQSAMLSVVEANIVSLSQADLVDVTLTLRQARKN